MALVKYPLLELIVFLNNLEGVGRVYSTDSNLPCHLRRSQTTFPYKKFDQKKNILSTPNVPISRFPEKFNIIFLSDV